MQVKWQATLRTLCCFQTLVALWRHLQDIQKVSDGGLVYQGSMMGKLDLELGQDNGTSAGEMDGGLVWQAACHLICS